MAKKGKINSLIMGFDILGFATIFLGSVLIRFSKDEVTPIIGGLVMAIGVAVLGVSRLIPK